MNAKPKFEILPPMPSRRDLVPMDVFPEDRTQQDLTAFLRTPGVLEKYRERLRIRSEINGQIAILNNYTRLTEAGNHLIAARTQLERLKVEYLRLGHELQIKAKENEAVMAKHDADVAEQQLRRDKAIYKRQHLEQFVDDSKASEPEQLAAIRLEKDCLAVEVEIARLRKEKDDLKNPPKPVSQITPEQRKAKEKKECEERIATLKTEKQEALKLPDEDELIRKVNALDDALQKEYDRWARLI